ncbi:MAG: adenylyl-sulfate kinase [Bacteroidia bacterium]|nr:adenylyl-sulfate kinase [Bacteroidia bacterium]
MSEVLHIIPHQHQITQQSREELLKQRGAVLWFTGLSGAGKSTMAGLVERELYQMGYKTYLLDGDNVRTGLNNNLSFSEDDRAENIRRIGEVCRLFVDAGIIVLSAFISPMIADRNFVRSRIDNGCFFEIYVNASLAVCESRDVKGLYQKARSGEIKQFTGISSPFEPPLNPELELLTGASSPEACLQQVLQTVLPKLKYS